MSINIVKNKLLRTLEFSVVDEDIKTRLLTIYQWHWDNKIAGTYISPDGSRYGEYIITAALQLYYITGDAAYLTVAKAAADDFYDGRDGTTNIPRLTNSGGTRITSTLDDVIKILPCFFDLAFLDPANYKSKLETIMNGIYSYGMYETNNLFYYSLKTDGTHVNVNGFSGYDIGSWNMAKLFFAVWLLTQNPTHLDRCARFVKGLWDLKNATTNLIPRYFNVETKAILNAWLKQGEEMGDALLTLSYIVSHGVEKHTFDATTVDFKDILEKSMAAAHNYFWKAADKRWNYKVNTDGTVNDSNAECVFSILDLGLLLSGLTLNSREFLDRPLMDMKNHYNELKDGVGRIKHGTVTPNERLFLANVEYIQTAYLFYAFFGDKEMFNNAETLRGQLDTWKHASGRYFYLYDTSTGLDTTSRNMFHFYAVPHVYTAWKNKPKIHYAPHASYTEGSVFALIDGWHNLLSP